MSLRSMSYWFTRPTGARLAATVACLLTAPLLAQSACSGDLEDADAYDDFLSKLHSRTPNEPPVAAAGTIVKRSALQPEKPKPQPPTTVVVSQSDAGTPSAKPTTPGPKLCQFVQVEGCPDVPTQIFAVSCGTANCHGSQGQRPRGYTDLGYSVNDVATRLLDLPGSPREACAEGKVIDTVQPEASLLLRKLDPVPPCGLHMPFGTYKISDFDKSCIERWVTAAVNGETKVAPCLLD